MKKIIITAAIILATGAAATSGIKLLNRKQPKVQTTLFTSNTTSGKEIASAD
jgi:hypothetical protein